MAKKPDNNDVTVTTPRHILREKIGFGGIEPAKLKKVQDMIEGNKVDFEPYAQDFLTRIERSATDARKQKSLDRRAIAKIINPVMEMKANGGMFRYKLLTEIADILLNFLEELPELNDDAFNLIDVHSKTMRVIVSSKLAGDGGKAGKALADELYGATLRYRKKHGAAK